MYLNTENQKKRQKTSKYTQRNTPKKYKIHKKKPK